MGDAALAGNPQTGGMNPMQDFASATLALAYALAEENPDRTWIAVREEEARDAFRRLQAEESARV